MSNGWYVYFVVLNDNGFVQVDFVITIIKSNKICTPGFPFSVVVVMVIK